DERRTRVSGAVWEEASQYTIKIEGSEWVGERAVLLAGCCDPRVIANSAAIIEGVRANVADIIAPTEAAPYQLLFHTYGKGEVSLFDVDPGPDAPEVFFLVECIAPTADLAK